MELSGLMARIFQHEIDHLDGELMWDAPREIKVPRRLDKIMLVAEVDADPDKFYEENDKYLIQY